MKTWIIAYLICSVVFIRKNYHYVIEVARNWDGTVDGFLIGISSWILIILSSVWPLILIGAGFYNFIFKPYLTHLNSLPPKDSQ